MSDYQENSLIETNNIFLNECVENLVGEFKPTKSKMTPDDKEHINELLSNYIVYSGLLGDLSCRLNDPETIKSFVDAAKSYFIKVVLLDVNNPDPDSQQLMVEHVESCFDKIVYMFTEAKQLMERHEEELRTGLLLNAEDVEALNSISE